ncbi:hypothetical protein Poli38472_007182 [Pythium oligandrum]|uniref:Major facilitator superfamily (MFS) profile domain-containing protein n=1 Tax=Pythium oligandrum TaxID=41045 RepID=A0A8K1CAU1_PYTOL|nr:hypothetical protein Poli38472_007182 [Pythium oligandrum]|eukprot:TMW59037.1 hypothetical protein Poli38472_007182 [Pythium oligandrum]
MTQDTPLKGSNHIEDVQRITRRIDAIGERHPGVMFGLSWYYIRLIFLTGIGWAMDAMETLVFTYVGGMIKEDITYGPHQGSFLAGAVFVGSFIGSFMFGPLSDKYGRRPMFLVTLMIFLAGFALCGAAWNITALTFFRIFAGIGLGGELPVVSTLVQELSPKKTRGKIIVLLEAFWAFGGMLAIAMAFGVAPHTGWREMFYICCIPVVYGAVVRFGIPESPKWLASVGRWEEAVAVVEKIERSHGLEPYDEKKDVDSVPSVTSTYQLPESHLARIKVLFQPPFVVRTIVLWTLWFGISMSYYAIFIFLPTLIAAKGVNINENWERILLITAFQLPGYFSAAWLVEKLGRRYTLVLYLFGAFASAIALAYVPTTTVNVIASASAMAFFMLGAWGCVYAYTPENYPTAIRGIGAAYPSGFSRIGAFSGPYLCNDMLEWGMTLESILWVFGGVLVFIAAVVLLFGYEPQGKNVEDYGDYKEGFQEISTPGVN